MATYPTLPVRHGADPKPINQVEIDRAEDGTGYARSFYSADKMHFSLEHPWLTTAQKAALDAFYSANRLLDFDYESPASGMTHTCIFAKAPAYEYHRPGFWTARVEMEEV